VIARIVLSAVLLSSVSIQAHAFCRDDLKELRPRIDRSKQADPARYALANRWWNRAMQEEPYDEVACLEHSSRARKALSGSMGVSGSNGPVTPMAPLGTPPGQQ